MKYETKKDAMETEEGKRLYKVLSEGFDLGFRFTASHVRDVMHRNVCYLGSTHHIETLVYKILNSEVIK